ncbi:putative yir3 protein [Plasmodium yoelii yoelii]|uniref:Yir3 protein n=1 Tax=Plasmodium yoelii yoelii TaxID=73239 RepID=Q7RBL1_PLAYO|nr:putative yir3 protein [Plasmodium yoelii yoelii]
MNKEVCKRFKNIRESIPSQLDSNKEYQINDNHLDEYCASGCNTSLDKISAGCLYLFDSFFKDKSKFESVAENKIYIVEYILIWLIYMLNLIKTKENDSITIFYNTYIEGGDKYTKKLDYIDSYKYLIDENKYFLSMDMSIITKLYDVFNTLCDIYNGLDTNALNCAEYSQKANQFVERYKQIIIDHNITEDKLYSHVFIILLIDYEKLKNKCKIFPSIPDITTIISEVTSSSSIARKLIPVVSIFAAIAIFLGISYKVNNKELKNIRFKYYFH